MTESFLNLNLHLNPDEEFCFCYAGNLAVLATPSLV
jgi:hypothetical protein